MDVVFYIEISGSFGEREHALSFARQIETAGYRPRFVVRPLIEDHIRRAGFEPQVFDPPQAGVEIVRNLAPSLIIACELFNLSAASKNGLAALDAPLYTIDGTTLPVEINTNPFRNPQFSRSLVLPERYVSFRPCPIHDAGPDTDTTFHYSLFPEASRVAKDERHYASLGLDPSRKTVMIGFAPWAMGGAELQGLQSYYGTLLGRIIDGLNAFGEPIDLLIVSRGGHGCVRKGAVTVSSSDLVSYDIYDHMVRSCDGIVSDNIIQTSLSKAVVMEGPHLVIQNTRPSDFPFPFNMFPLKLLFPAEREYARIVDVAEYGDTVDIREKLLAMLQDGHCDPERRERRRSYRDRLGRLSPPGAILERVLGAPSA